MTKLYILFEYLKTSLWILIKFRKFRKLLYIKYQYTDIKFFKYKSWHHGHYYFTAMKGDIKIFIKTDFQLQLLQNEVTAIKFMQMYNELNCHIPTIVNYDEINYSFISFVFIEGVHFNKLNIEKISLDNRLSIYKKLFDILSVLNSNNIIYRDVKPDNLIIVKLNNEYIIKIIDFTFTISTNKFLNFIETDDDKILSLLGNYYKPSEYIWDDIYSLQVLLREVEEDFIIDNEVFGELYYMIDKKQNNVVYACK